MGVYRQIIGDDSLVITLGYLIKHVRRRRKEHETRHHPTAGSRALTLLPLVQPNPANLNIFLDTHSLRHCSNSTRSTMLSD